MAANTRVSNINRILQGLPFPSLSKSSSAAASTVLESTGKNIGTAIQKSTAAIGMSMPTFSTSYAPSSTTTKYVSYILLGIVVFIAIILFLQSIGVTIIQERWGANGLIPSPFKDSSAVLLSDLYGTGVGSSFNLSSPGVFTVNIPIFISSGISSYNESVPILLFYRSSLTPDSTINNTKTQRTGQINLPNNIDDYFLITRADGSRVTEKPYQFAVYLDGLSKDLIVSFYDKLGNKPPAATLSNPPLDIGFNLTIIANNTYAEVYSNGKLKKTIVFENSILEITGAKFVAHSNPNITIDPTTVSIWNQVLTANEISNISIQSTLPVKSSWSKFWKNC